MWPSCRSETASVVRLHQKCRIMPTDDLRPHPRAGRLEWLLLCKSGHTKLVASLMNKLLAASAGWTTPRVATLWSLRTVRLLQEFLHYSLQVMDYGCNGGLMDIPSRWPRKNNIWRCCREGWHLLIFNGVSPSGCVHTASDSDASSWASNSCLSHQNHQRREHHERRMCFCRAVFEDETIHDGELVSFGPLLLWLVLPLLRAGAQTVKEGGHPLEKTEQRFMFHTGGEN